MKLGIIREQPKIWELSLLEGLSKYEISPGVICPINKSSSVLKLDMHVDRLLSYEFFNKIPLLSKFLQYRYSLNGRMFNFNKTAKKYDVLSPIEIGWASTYQAVKSGVPTVVKVWENIPYNWDLFPYLDKIRKTRNPKFAKYVAKNAALFLAASELSKEALILNGVTEEKIRVIYEGVDTNLFKPMKVDKEKFRKKYGFSVDDKILLFIGRLVWEKGVRDLLFMMKSLVSEKKNVKLIIIGEGPLKKSIKEAINVLKLDKNVIMIDRIDFFSLPEVYNNTDVFVLPSMPLLRFTEQFGKVLTEAMSCGVPVVSTLCGGIPEVVDDGKAGFLVPPCNWVKLKESVMNLLEDEDLRKKMGKHAREYILNKFDSDLINKKLAEAYKSVIK